MYSEHYRALSEIVFALNSMVLKAVVGQQFPLSRSEVGGIVTNDMSAEGIGKVRYCGAWAIAKERYRCQDYFRSNIYSSDHRVKSKQKKLMPRRNLVQWHCQTKITVPGYFECDFVSDL